MNRAGFRYKNLCRSSVVVHDNMVEKHMESIYGTFYTKEVQD